MEKLPVIWTIVLTYNACEMTRDCLKSLLEADYPSLKILLVDNASADDTVTVVQNDFPQVAVLQNPKNYMFAKGNNRGIAYALKKGAEYVFILNNDTLVETHCLHHLISFMHNHPDCAACQPLLLQMHDPERVASAGCRVTLSGRAKDLYDGLPIDDIAPHPFPVCGVTGGAFLVRSAALQKTGLFCPYFKMYFEDVDLSLRLQEQGDSLCCVPAAKVRHYVSASTKKKGIFFHTYYTERNSYFIVLRNYPLRQVLRSYIFKIPAALASLAVNLFKGHFSYSLAVFLSLFYGILAFFLFLPVRALESVHHKKKFPFWHCIEKNRLYP